MMAGGSDDAAAASNDSKVRTRAQT